MLKISHFYSVFFSKELWGGGGGVCNLHSYPVQRTGTCNEPVQVGLVMSDLPKVTSLRFMAGSLY